MTLWYVWVILGIVFFIVEIFTPGFVLATFGIGCLVAAIPAALNGHFLWQLVGFVLGSFLAFLVVRPLYLKFIFPEKEQIPTNVDALVGQQAIVIEEINPIQNSGRVKVGGEDWKAISTEGNVIPKNKVVQIVAVDGVKLLVKELKTQ